IYTLFPDPPFLVFFETGLFLNLPEIEKKYAVNSGNKEADKYLKSGFHGIWHSYNSQIPINPNKTISIVLDKTTTICAFNKKEPVSTSYGSSDLGGIMGNLSCGDIDPGIIFYLMKKNGYSLFKMDEILKNQSGFKGLTNINKNLDILIREYEKNEDVNF